MWASYKLGANKTWQLVEQHGLWWAYQGDMPSPEAFQTHGRPYHLPLLGPYPSRKVAEAGIRDRNLMPSIEPITRGRTPNRNPAKALGAKAGSGPPHKARGDLKEGCRK